MSNYKPIPQFPGYRAGDDGTIWTCLERAGYGIWRCGVTWRKIKPQLLKSGYLKVGLCLNGKYFQRLVHRLVLQAFVGPCPEGKEAAHDNGIRTDCRLDNLAWKTKKENAADRDRHGTTPRGEKHYRSRARRVAHA